MIIAQLIVTEKRDLINWISGVRICLTNGRLLYVFWEKK